MKPFICEFRKDVSVSRWIKVEAPDPFAALALVIAECGNDGPFIVDVYGGHSIPWGDDRLPLATWTQPSLEASKKPEAREAPQSRRGDKENRLKGWLGRKQPGRDVVNS
jgi:hypothetical protein